MRQMRILVTGGAGFIGSHLVAELVARGEDVVVLDSFEEQVHGNGAGRAVDGATVVVGDVGDAAAVERALDGVDRVVHLAAAVGVGQSMYEIERYVRRNTMATATFLEQVVARRDVIRRLVVASSMSIYGEGEYRCPEHGYVSVGTRTEDMLVSRQWECICPLCGQVLDPVPTRETKPLIPTSVYAITKRDHEELCLVVGRAYEIPTAALQFFNVYGPGQALSNPYTGVAAIFASRLLNGRPPVIFEDGQQTRDFIHVSDIVLGLRLALESDVANITVNLGTGSPVSVNDVAVTLGRKLGVDLEPERTGQFRAGDIRHCYADATAARDALGFTAQMSFEEGFGRLGEWLAGQHAEDLVDAATDELRVRGLAR